MLILTLSWLKGEGEIGREKGEGGWERDSQDFGVCLREILGGGSRGKRRGVEGVAEKLPGMEFF